MRGRYTVGSVYRAGCHAGSRFGYRFASGQPVSSRWFKEGDEVEIVARDGRLELSKVEREKVIAEITGYGQTVARRLEIRSRRSQWAGLPLLVSGFLDTNILIYAFDQR